MAFIDFLNVIGRIIRKKIFKIKYEKEELYDLNNVLVALILIFGIIILLNILS